jgi:antitoxin FitA
MAGVLVRNLSPATVERLKSRAVRHRRSLQAEVKAILEQAADTLDMEEFRAAALAMQKRLAGRRQTDSAILIREGRDR